MQLAGFPIAQQQHENSCWACAARMIVNWFSGQGRAGGRGTFDADDTICDAVPAYAGQANKMSSAADLLAELGFESGIDDSYVPTLKEIEEHLASDAPLLALVTEKAPPPKTAEGKVRGDVDGTEYGGHWVVLVGADGAKGTLDVFDPADGSIRTVAYDTTKYSESQYWANTSYVDPVG